MIKTIHGILLILYIIVCVALTVVVILQEGKQAGLTGAISGAAESYWGKNKGRSMEGGDLLWPQEFCSIICLINFIESPHFFIKEITKKGSLIDKTFSFLLL